MMLLEKELFSRVSLRNITTKGVPWVTWLKAKAPRVKTVAWKYGGGKENMVHRIPYTHFLFNKITQGKCREMVQSYNNCPMYHVSWYDLRTANFFIHNYV